MESNMKNMSFCPFTHPHQKKVLDGYLINKNSQNLTFNTPSASKIYVILSPNSLQIAANQMYQTPSLLFHLDIMKI
jgi:hypothetical protein